MQETQVQSLDLEDSICHTATKPVCHSYQASALEPLTTTTEAHAH